MQPSMRTACITIGAIFFSFVPMIFVVAYSLNSCEGGCGDVKTVHEKITNGGYLLIGMYSCPVVSFIIDYIEFRREKHKLTEVAEQ